MQITFETNRTYKPQFGNANVTERAVRHLKSRYMTQEDIERLGKVIDRFNKKGKFIEGTLDEIHGNLTASIWSSGRYSETKTEGWFSHLFRSPISFIEKWADRADRVEQRLQNDIRIEEIAK